MPKRAANLNIFRVKYPPTAMVSILHRISGVLLVCMIPLLIWMLSESLTSKRNFNALKAILSTSISKFIIWLICSALIYHLMAGMRHLFMDLGVAKTKQASTISAKAVLGLFIISAICLGVGIW